jgi:hypothetical protein
MWKYGIRLTLVPNWRIMMPPAGTGWPPYTLTPLLLLTESLPFFVEPAPFLWAASMVSGVGATLDAALCWTACPPRKAEFPRLSPLNELHNIVTNFVYTHAMRLQWKGMRGF